jgi:probable HAF family extracellular repeat protein
VCRRAAPRHPDRQISGDSADGSGGTHAVVWTNGTITDLGTLGDSGLNGFAYAINNLGQVAGVSMITNSTEGPFLYSGGKMTDLGSNFTAAAINDNTVIVGSSSTGAAVWSNGVLHLNDPIPPGSGIALDQATAINDNGQIVAETSNGTVFLLTPADHHPGLASAFRPPPRLVSQPPAWSHRGASRSSERALTPEGASTRPSSRTVGVGRGSPHCAVRSRRDIRICTFR